MIKRLMPHQMDALSVLHNGCVLQGGVGSGKTITALCFIFTKWLNGRTPLVTENQFTKGSDTKVYVITTARKRNTLDWVYEAGNVPMQLEVVDSWNNISKYVDVEDSVFIFDETRVLGYGAWTKSFLKITKKNKWLLLSATPADTWVEYAPLFIANGFYKNITEFYTRHVVWAPYSKYPKILKYTDVDVLERYRSYILVPMDVERNALRNFEDVICRYDKEAYDNVFKNLYNIYTKLPILNASELCYTLRRVINSDGSRLDAVFGIFEKHNKLIVFYNFNYELDALVSFFESRNIETKQYNGRVHEEVPTTNRWLYLCQYTAASDAWNCTATNAVVFYSQTYSYKQFVQAAGRIDRLNTPFKILHYYTLISESEIDRRIKEALLNKKNFNENSFYMGYNGIE